MDNNVPITVTNTTFGNILKPWEQINLSNEHSRTTRIVCGLAIALLLIIFILQIMSVFVRSSA